MSCLLPCTAVIIAAGAGLCLYLRFAAETAFICTVLLTAASAAVIITVLAVTSLRFLRTITQPVHSLTDISRRISAGSLGIQADKPRDDEIGGLFDSINELSAELAQSERLQTEFISSVSHELRTPLTAITGWSETLEYDENIQGDSRRGISIISREAGRLSKMVGELLEFTRIQGGRFKLNMERMDAETELADAVLTYSQLARQEGMELVYAPPEGPAPLINGDPERLKQVFLNVLDNAAKYGREGGRIVVKISKETGYIVVTIRDFGPGIPEDEIEYVKMKFYKGSSKQRGSGIGLAVCEEIVDYHNGELILRNADGGGLEVSVKLPTYE